MARAKKPTPTQSDWEAIDRLVRQQQDEYERLVLNNADLRSECMAFRKEHNISFSLDHQLDYINWLEGEVEAEVQKMRAEGRTGSVVIELEALVQQKAEHLARLHGAERWVNEIRGLILFGGTWAWFSSGMPGGVFPAKGSTSPGQVTTNLYFDPTNPAHQDAYNAMKRMVDPLPKPRAKKNDSRALDWQPVMAWAVRHPSVSLSEIAKELGYNAVTVRKKLAGIRQDK